MLPRDNAVIFLASWIDACALWRLFMPHLNMPGSSFFCFANKPDWNVIAGNDVVVVQRCCTRGQFEFLKVVNSLGMKLVYDLDDNVWELPEYNPAHKALMMHREGFAACIQMVDVVTVSTRALAKAVKQHVKSLVNSRTHKEIPVVVVENRIEERMFAAARQAKRKTVGWAGSSSHIGDLLLVQEAVEHLANEMQHVEFEFRGCDPPASLLGFPNFRFKQWTPVAEYGARMPRWGWSVALAPVQDLPFNDSKSCIKMVEAAYCGIPCLASWTKAYEEFVKWDKELQWLLCAGKSGWERKLRVLLNDDEFREQMGARMWSVMREHYSFAARPHEGWDQALQLARD
jgi:O-antigen biosynthesis protein